MNGPYILTLRTATGTPITGKVKADFALTYYVDGADTATTAITITEVGSTGDYLLYVPDAATNTDHTLIIEDGGSLGVAAGWQERATWPNRPDTADFISAGGTLTYSGAVTPTGDVEIVRGDDYSNTDGRALNWTDASWPTLTGGTIAFSVRDNEGIVLIDSIAGVIVDASTIYVELTAAQTTVDPGKHRFDVQATLVSGRVVTLQLGKCRIFQEVTRM